MDFPTDKTYRPFRNLDDWGAAGEPSKLGVWVLEEQLGAGGWGVVYRARHEKIGLVRAVKLLRPALAQEEKNRRNFEEEARLLVEFGGNPRVVRVHDYDEEKGFAWLVMDLAEGLEAGDGSRLRSVAQWQAWNEKQHGTRRLPEAWVERIGLDVLEALAGAHGSGRVHRDIKPGNILLDGGGRALLADFGLAKVLEPVLSEVREGSRSVDHKSASGASIVGTFAYMSPEQESGGDSDPRSDLYGVGVVLYELLTGDLPRGRFEMPGEMGLGVAGWWDAFLERALQNRREKRWQSAAEMREALARRPHADRLAKARAAEEAALREAEAKKEAQRQREAAQREAASREEPIPGAQNQPVRRPIPAPPSTHRRSSRWPWLAAVLLITALTVWGIIVVGTHGRAENGAGSRAVEEREFEIAPGVSKRFCWIPAGSFRMGSPATEEGRYDDETLHQVTLSKGFWLAKHECTQAEWQAVMGNNPSHFKGDDLPVETVSWTDICGNEQRTGGFLGAANRHAPAGWRFDLPTEAQWEYACRAGTTGAYSGGTLDEVGWYDNNSGSKTHPVGLKKPNAWGLCDMHGNVWECCRDWHGAYPSGSVIDPTGASSGFFRVFRGGSWSSDAAFCRAASRGGYQPGTLNNLGFRPALVPSGSK